MLFKPEKGKLMQLLCTYPDRDNPDLYDGSVAKSAVTEFEEDVRDYEARRHSEKDGWLKYANGQDKPWVAYHKKFDGNNVSKKCQRTAPASFRYETPVEWVLPPKRARYYSKTLNVPRNPQKYASNYFGADYMTPKRRYG